MLQRIERHNARQPPGQNIRVSVEVEKTREELFQLFGYGDVVSTPRGFSLPHPALSILKKEPEYSLGLPATPGMAYSWLGSVGKSGAKQIGWTSASGLWRRPLQ